MDRLIRRFTAVRDEDLMLCLARGAAYQRDMSHRVHVAYFEKCAGYAGGEIAEKINAGRRALVGRHVGDAAVLDVGIGCGEFVSGRPNTFGFDVQRQAVDWLKEKGLWADDFSRFSAFTFWDVLEHVEHPEHYLRAIPPGGYLFASLPIFEDLTRIRSSKHYRPGEHLYYWTEAGFVGWLREYQFELLERQDFETAAGRDSILSFAFRRTLPGYHETLAQYQQLHGKFYGSSAHLFFDQIAGEVLRLNPGSILDFGCGRSDLVAHFWADGRRRIARYDPAIAEHETLPAERFDLVLCTDVMEHIPMTDVDGLLGEIKEKSDRALFTISTRAARAKLPDGRNAHITLLSDAEWTAWVKDWFGKAERIPTRWDHILMLRTY